MKLDLSKPMNNNAIAVALHLTAVIMGCAQLAVAQVQPTRIGVLGPAEEPRFSEVLDGLRQGFAITVIRSRLSRSWRVGWSEETMPVRGLRLSGSCS